MAGWSRGMRIPYLLAVHDAVRHPAESAPLLILIIANIKINFIV